MEHGTGEIVYSGYDKGQLKSKIIDIYSEIYSHCLTKPFVTSVLLDRISRFPCSPLSFHVEAEVEHLINQQGVKIIRRLVYCNCGKKKRESSKRCYICHRKYYTRAYRKANRVALLEKKSIRYRIKKNGIVRKYTKKNDTKSNKERPA